MSEGLSERTMMVDIRQLMPPDKPWKPFRFSNLEKVARTQAHLASRLPWLAPPGDVGEPVCARLKQVFDSEVHFSVEAVQVRPASELRQHLSQPGFLAVLAPGALAGRAVLEVELALAHAAVDMLLGGAGETVGLRPLTEIEEGVMSFVVLEALKAVAPSLEQGLPRLRLESVARGADEVASKLGEEGHLVTLHFNAVLGSHAGMVRLVVPASVLEAAVPAKDSERRRAKLRADLQAHVGRLSAVRTWLRAEIGHAEILRRDLASLRVKDVVLLDALTARPDRGEGGTVRLRVGAGRVGRLDAELVLEDDQFKARIEALVLGGPVLQSVGAAEAQGEEDEEYTNPELEMPPEAQGGADVDDVNKPEGSDLLGDVPLQIAVELARVPVSAEEIVALRPGQVIELNRSPGEPVELSVNGKVVARGELVEVEGHLGVRVLSLG
jgi:flagellar motor switch protein FliM